MPAKQTVTELLDAAQHMVQERGYNAFSYKDLAEEVGIRTASIHYHFPAKADLGQALMQRYLEQLDQALAELDASSKTNKSRLKAFIAAYRQTESRGAICLCGSMASDLASLPVEVQKVVAAYLDHSERWIKRRLEEGQRAGEFSLRGKPGDVATTLLASLQGALLVARAREHSALESVQRSFLNSLEAA